MKTLLYLLSALFVTLILTMMVTEPPTIAFLPVTLALTVCVILLLWHQEKTINGLQQSVQHADNQLVRCVNSLNSSQAKTEQLFQEKLHKELSARDDYVEVLEKRIAGLVAEAARHGLTL